MNKGEIDFIIVSFVFVYWVLTDMCQQQKYLYGCNRWSTKTLIEELKLNKWF